MLTHSFSHIGNRYWWISPLHYKGFTPNSPSAMLGALESGARQLSVPALARMVAATGLQLDLRACEPATIGAPSGALGQRVQARRVESCRAAGRAGRLRVAQPHPAPPLDLFGLDAYTPRG